MPSDPIGDKPRYPSTNRYGIPDLPPAPTSAIPAKLVPYRTRLRGPHAQTTGAAVHFFLYDAIFESTWRAPGKADRYLRNFDAVLTPDFSLGVEMPPALQIYNTYRTRWCGAHWHAAGYQVIPTVAWSTPASYDFCFAGLPRFTVVALTTVGSRRQKASFMHGYDALIERVGPATVMCYGTPFPEMAARTAVQPYPTRYDLRKRKRKEGDYG